MSQISNDVYKLLREIFPHNVILKEHYVKYKGTKLFFDFYIKDLNVLIEVQGQQHLKFVKHFHENKNGFVAQKRRDNMKIEYAQENDIAFVRIFFDEEIDKDLITDKIYRALSDESGFCD